MRTAIVGAGNAGKDLAAKLCEMHQDVVVIDNNAAALKDVSSNHDVMTFEGSGSDPSVFNRGEIAKTEFARCGNPS